MVIENQNQNRVDIYNSIAQKKIYKLNWQNDKS